LLGRSDWEENKSESAEHGGGCGRGTGRKKKKEFSTKVKEQGKGVDSKSEENPPRVFREREKKVSKKKEGVNGEV